jgi:mRNA interferase MazF
MITRPLPQRRSERWTKRRIVDVPERGEVWQVDFGITQKVRPALVISIPYADIDRALIGVIPHTTATRGSQFEVSVRTPFLTEDAFLVQGIQALPPKYFLRRLGLLTADQLRKVEAALLHWAGLASRA